MLSPVTTTTMDSDIHHQPSSFTAAAASTKGGPAIDRHNPIIQDRTRLTKTLPKIKNNNKDQYEDNKSNYEQLNMNRNRSNNNNVVRRQGGVLFGWVCTRPGDFISPASSSRFLLTDKSLSDQFDPLSKQGLPPAQQHPTPPPLEETVKPEDDESSKRKDDENAFSYSVKTPPRSPLSSLSSRSSNHQVVVLRVSLHCRGCEKKMRKHLSKMEGVTSFTIDFMAKTVTVVGDITPLDVLMSVSKVKNAKLLTPTTISSPTEPRMDLNFSKVDKNLGLVA